jgi:hypothetical protein
MGMNRLPPQDKPLYRPPPPPPSNRSWEDVERSLQNKEISSSKKEESDDGVGTFIIGAIIGSML